MRQGSYPNLNFNTNDPLLFEYIEETLKKNSDKVKAFTWISSDIVSTIEETGLGTV